MQAETDSCQKNQLHDRVRDRYRSEKFFGVESWYHFFPKSRENPIGEDAKDANLLNGQSIESLLDLITGSRHWLRKSESSQQFFTEDGFAIHVELDEEGRWCGGIKISTPECDSMAQMAVALEHSKIMVNRLLRRHPDLTAFRNQPSTEEHRFNPVTTGIEENYEVQVVTQTELKYYRSLIYVVFFLSLLAKWATNFFVLFLSTIAKLNLRPQGNQEDLSSIDVVRRTPTWIRTPTLAMIRWIHGPTTHCLHLISRFIAFRQHRQYLSAFLITRPILFGTGNFDPANRFALSESARKICRISGVEPATASRQLLRTSHWVKTCCREIFLSNSHCLDLLSQKQRLQLGPEEANHSNQITLTKIAITRLVIEMIEDGKVTALPILQNPIKTLSEVNQDWYLLRQHSTNIGQLSAIEIQEAYLQAVEMHLSEGSHETLGENEQQEDRKAVAFWKQSLQLLKQYASDGNIDQNATYQIQWLAQLSDLEITQSRKSEPQPQSSGEHRNVLKRNRDESLDQASKITGVAPHYLMEESVEFPLRVQNRIRFIRQHCQSDQAVEITWKRGSIGEHPTVKQFNF